jgi:hypothetical protein
MKYEVKLRTTIPVITVLEIETTKEQDAFIESAKRFLFSEEQLEKDPICVGMFGGVLLHQMLLEGAVEPTCGWRVKWTIEPGCNVADGRNYEGAEVVFARPITEEEAADAVGTTSA